MNIDQDHVLTCEGVILWDGITQPDENDRGEIIHSLRIAISSNAAERTELEALANRALSAHQTFQGALPPGGEWPMREIDLSKYVDDAATLTGRVAINANTRQGAPQVFDLNGGELSAMQYGRMLYPGAVVKMLVHCYAFDNKSKGVALGLDGIQIVDATTPRLSVGGGMASSAVAAVFAATTAPPAATTAPPAATTAPPAATTAPPDTAFVANAGTPARIMLPAAGAQTYDQLIAAGWTDELLVQHKFMLA